jgi:hypothetical protein
MKQWPQSPTQPPSGTVYFDDVKKICCLRKEDGTWVELKEVPYEPKDAVERADEQFDRECM